MNALIHKGKCVNNPLCVIVDYLSNSSLNCYFPLDVSFALFSTFPFISTYILDCKYKKDSTIILTWSVMIHFCPDPSVVFRTG